jgi:HEAT repeat protein
MNLGHHRDEAAVPVLIEALDEAGSVRRAAAWALARIGLPAAEAAKPKLLQVLPDTDERDHAQVVWTLAVLREPGVADALLESFSKGELSHLDGFSPKIVAEVLGTERLSSDALLTHTEPSVRQLTANALAEAATPAVVDPLTRLLENELAKPQDDQQEEVIRSAVAGLGRTGDARAATPLFSTLQRRPGLRGSVIDALRRSTGAPQIAALMNQAQDPSLKRDLAQLLAETHDDRARDALANLLTSEAARSRRSPSPSSATSGRSMRSASS